MTHLDIPPLVGQARTGPVLWLRLGAGRAHALSLAMIKALHDAVQQADTDPEVRVIVVHGPGSIFCAGHDLKEIARHRRDDDLGQAYLETLFERCGDMMMVLAGASKPTIALVEGIATAGGLQLVASCDLAFATPEATFCLPGVSNGGFCTTPAVAVGRVLGRRHLMEMLLSGARYDAEWATASGLINRVVPGDEIAGFVQTYGEALARAHAPAVADGKSTLTEQLEMPLAQAYARASAVMVGHFMDPARIEKERATWG